MRRTRRGVGKDDPLPDALTLIPLQEHIRNLELELENDHDHNPNPISPSSASHPHPGRPELPISDFTQKSPSRRRYRRRVPGKYSGRRSAKKSETVCSNPEVGTLETGVSSPKVDDSVRAQSEIDESAVENLEAETSKDENDKEFDVMERFEELGFGVDEPELTEEQLKANFQAQEDELLVMESMYGENVTKLESHEGPKTFQVNIEIEASNEITVTTKLVSTVNHTTGDGTSDDFSYSFKVHYLPPIVLTCLLPKSYPSHRPPYFTISAQWLDTINISNLCSKLDSMWDEQSGQEIIYQWVEWLSSSSLSHLGFGEKIVLGPYATRESDDRRAISGSVSPDVDIPSIRRYNNERLHESFLQNLQDCCICYSEYAGIEFAMLPCNHFFCWKCMKTYSDIHVSEGTVSKLLCPETKCRGMIPPSLLKRLLSQEEYERWESLTLEKSLDAMPDVTHCPRCDMPCIADEDEHAQCSKCFFSFCTICRDRRHVGVECLTPEMKLRILEERQNSNVVKEEQKRKEREMINEVMSMRAILQDAKQCPSCKMAISRIDGCNKMICNNCNQFFCYRCNKAIAGYDHFQNGTCELFPPAMTVIREREVHVNWEERLNDRQLMGQMRAQLAVGQGQGLNCPSCRQFNVKIGNNNHLFCWACQVHYCYLCKQIVRRSSEHYGPKGCKQHSVS